MADDGIGLGAGGSWTPPSQTAPTFTTGSPAERSVYSDTAPAGWWVRVGAPLIDGVIMMVGTAAIGGVAAVAGGADAFATAFVVAYVAALMFYAPVMVALHGGQTWGKQACEIRVINMSGEPIGFGRAFLREVPVKGILSFLWWIDVLWPRWQSQNRALHDLAVSTRVVED